MGDLGVPVELNPSTRVLQGGRLLVGGSPTSILRVSTPFTGSHSSTHLGARLLATGVGQPALEQVPRPNPSDLTVVVPAHDRPHLLDACLTALAPLTVIVVDDASRRPSDIAAVASRHGASLIALSENVGPSGARNTGLRQVTTPYVAFVDSDVVVTPEALLDVARHLHDPDVVFAAPRMRGTADAGARWFERHDAAASSLDLGVRSAEVIPGSPVAYLPSACIVARVDALRDGFDKSLRVGEDVDLVWRVRAEGGRARYDAGVVAHHRTRTTIRDWLGRVFAYGTSAAALAERHPDHVAPAAVRPLDAAAALLVLARSRWSVPVASLALLASYRRALAALGSGDGTHPEATRLAVRSLGWAVRQESSLALRHWWPATLVALLCGRRRGVLRRIVASALVADSAVVWAEANRRRAAGDQAVGFPTLVAGRRLDDLAYGAGVWAGVLRARSARALRPRVVSPKAARAPR